MMLRLGLRYFNNRLSKINKQQAETGMQVEEMYACLKNGQNRRR